MNEKAEALQQKGYHLQETLHHEELIPFVQKIFSQPNIIIRLFFWMNVLLLLWLIILIIYLIMQGQSTGQVIGQLGWGILLIIPIIPFHEWIHGLVYKQLGAPKVHYTANFKKFYFTAQADAFVVGEDGFYRLAFAPFVVINLIALLFMILLPADYLLILSSFLFMHTIACGGDFALAAYFFQHKDKGLITFDDVPNKTTYFMIKNSDS